MTGTLVSFAAVQAGTFNDTNLVGRVLGDGDARRRVEELLQEQKTIIRAKLDDNKHLIAALRDALVERHELVGREIEAVLESAGGPVDLTTPAMVIDLRDEVVAPQPLAALD